MPNGNLHYYTDLKYTSDHWKCDSCNKRMLLQNRGKLEITNKLCYYWNTREDLKFNSNFFQEEFVCMSTWNYLISSFCLFREANSGLQRYFSQRHRLHWFEVGLYGAACFKIFQVTLNFDLLSVTWKLPHITPLQINVTYASRRSTLLFVNLS